MGKRTCSIEGCGRDHSGRGLCRIHYARWHKTGSVDLKGRAGPRPPRTTLAGRFRAKHSPDPDGGCWTWTGHKTPAGYGRIWLYAERREAMAHRVSYELHVGPIPDGFQIDHLCRNRACVNPAHLEAVTQAENLRRGEGWAGQHARQTHCKHGHEFTPENTRITTEGRRKCRACNRAYDRTRRSTGKA